MNRTDAPDPYSTPSADLSETLPAARTTQAYVAFASALIVLLGIWFGAFALAGESPAIVEPMILAKNFGAVFIASVTTGFAALPFRNLKLYWVVLLAPFVAFVIFVLEAAAFGLVSVVI